MLCSGLTYDLPLLPNHRCNGNGCLCLQPSCLHHSRLYPPTEAKQTLSALLNDNSEKRNQYSPPYYGSQRGSRKSHLEASMPASHQLIFNTLTTRKRWLRQWQGVDFSAAFSALDREGTSQHPSVPLISTSSHFNFKYLSAAQPTGSYSEAES